MKRFLLLSALAVMLLAGCTTFSTPPQNEDRSRSFQLPYPVVFDAVRKTLFEMGAKIEGGRDSMMLTAVAPQGLGLGHYSLQFLEHESGTTVLLDIKFSTGNSPIVKTEKPWYDRFWAALQPNLP